MGCMSNEFLEKQIPAGRIIHALPNSYTQTAGCWLDFSRQGQWNIGRPSVDTLLLKLSSRFDLVVVRIDGPTRTSDGLLISGPIPTSCLSNGGGSKRPASAHEFS